MFNNKKYAMMMTITTHIKKENIFILFLGLTITTLMVSCGSFQSSSYYDTDGIYSSSNVNYNEVAVTEAPDDTQYSSVDAYRAYISELASEEIPNDSTPYFTDIDAYYSNDSVVDSTEVATNINYEYADNGYAGWGQNTSDVNVNVYSTPYYGYGFGFGYNYYGWGWNNPYYWNAGWYNPYWYGGFGFPNYAYGWGGYHGWNNYGWNGYYHPHYPYHRNNIAYSRTRRGTPSLAASRNTRSVVNNATRRVNRNAVVSRRRTKSATTRTRSNSRTRTYTPSTTRSTTRTRTYTPSTTRSTTRTRTYTPSTTRSTTRSYSPSRSSGSRTRTSGGGGRRR
ncbi:hypothetical protein NBRC110019_28880 [Neptunitalea chrysea]|uniref:Vitellogenin II n=1 Tax=Neptunitalea chrysea TaxID=1647581 RepID=A0A9W6B8U8_9FLAO|nr:hypothetical protein [Neptunitalea chrysea]GLB53847.1 hypothetical protein NBRC110019_28880 [Neptunitalea chrysea]